MRLFNLKETIIVLLLLILAAVGVHLYVDNQARNLWWQKAYPLHARLALQHIQCSKGSPSWMVELLRFSTHQQRAPANQLAYIDAQGHHFHCESGYQHAPLVSAPLTADNRFRFASVTKLWTSDAVLQLVNEGKLSLDTPVWTALGNLPSPQDTRILDITIGHLLLHRGGFDRLSMSGIDMFQQGGEEICPKHLHRLAEIRLNFDPGTKTAYSNLGYCLLGEVVAKQHGQAYTDYISSHYRLNNDGLRFIGRTAENDEVTYNHEEQGLTGIADIYTAFDYKSLASAAGLSGNAMGLAHQVKAMLLQPGLNITTQPQQSDCQPEVLRSCYGYAMFPYQASAQKPVVYFRDGKLPGLSSVVAVTDDNAVLVLLSNGTGGLQRADAVKQEIYRALTTKHE